MIGNWVWWGSWGQQRTKQHRHYSRRWLESLALWHQERPDSWNKIHSNFQRQQSHHLLWHPPHSMCYKCKTRRITTRGAVANNDAILQRLPAAIVTQGEATTKTNNLCMMEIQHQQTWEEHKKDRTKKLHPSILKMVSHAAATHSTDKNEALPATFTCFIICTLIWCNMTSSISSKTLVTWTSLLHHGWPKSFTWESFFTRIQAPWVTSQFLHSTNKSQIQTSSRTTTSSATCFKLKDKRNR